MTRDLEGSELIKMSYEKHGVKYSIYEGNNRFNGTPIPDGYEPVYVPKDDWGIPDLLQLKRIKNA